MLTSKHSRADDELACDVRWWQLGFDVVAATVRRFCSLDAFARVRVLMYFNLFFLLLLFNDVMISDSSDKNPAYTHGSLLQVPTTPLSVPLLLLQLTDVVTRFLSIVAVDQIRLRNNLTNTTLYYPMLLLHLNSRHTRPDHRNANLLRSPFFALFFLPVTLTHSPTGLTD